MKHFTNIVVFKQLFKHFTTTHRPAFVHFRSSKDTICEFKQTHVRVFSVRYLKGVLSIEMRYDKLGHIMLLHAITTVTLLSLTINAMKDPNEFAGRCMLDSES